MEVETINSHDLKNDARFAVLQTRKNIIEQELLRKNDVLRNLCVQELKLTGVLPLEISTLNNDCNVFVDNNLNNVKFNKNVGISYQFPVENCSPTEIEIQVQNGIAKAAYSLAKDESLSKNSRRENMFIFENCQQKLLELHNNLNLLRNINEKEEHEQAIKPDIDVSEKLSWKDKEATIKRSNKNGDWDSPDLCSLMQNTSSGPFRKETCHYAEMGRTNLCQQEKTYLTAATPAEKSVMGSKMSFGKHCRTQMQLHDPASFAIPSLPLSPSPSSTPTASVAVEIETYQPRPASLNSDFVWLPPPNFSLCPNKSSRSTTLQRKSYTISESKNGNSSFLSANKFGSLDRRKEKRFHCYDLAKNQSPHSRRDVFFPHPKVPTLPLGFTPPPPLPQPQPQLPSQTQPLQRTSESTLEFATALAPASTQKQAIFTADSTENQSKNAEKLKTVCRTQSLGNITSLVTEQKSNETSPKWHQGAKNQDTDFQDDSKIIKEGTSIAEDSKTCNKEKLWRETHLDMTPEKNLTEISYKGKKDCLNRLKTRRNSSIEHPLLSQSSQSSQSSPPSPSPSSSLSSCIKNDLALETPINCTVIESGKWLPYRETTKPFEMSDFYKYSTKFRSKQHEVTNK